LITDCRRAKSESPPLKGLSSVIGGGGGLPPDALPGFPAACAKTKAEPIAKNIVSERSEAIKVFFITVVGRVVKALASIEP